VESQRVILQLTDDVSESKLDNITRQMNRTLRDAGVDTNLLEHTGFSAGSKGDTVNIGAIVMTLIGSGGVAVSIINVLKAYADRRPSLRFNLKRADGTTLELSAQNLASAGLDQALKITDQFLKS